MRCLKFILFSALMAVVGCGGGSSGTGIRTFDGKVLKTDEQPLSQAKISIVETGENGTTESNGKFSILSRSESSEVQLKIEHPEIQTEVSITNIPADSTNVRVQLTVDVDHDTAEARRIDFSKISKFEISPTIEGICRGALSNVPGGIKQIRELPGDAVCLLKIFVTGDKQPLAGALVSLDRKSCQGTEGWRRVTAARTRSGVGQGIAEIRFPFLDSLRSCQYRIITEGESESADEIRIITLKGERYGLSLK